MCILGFVFFKTKCTLGLHLPCLILLLSHPHTNHTVPLTLIWSEKTKCVIAEMQPENISRISCEFYWYCLRQGTKVRRHRKSWKQTQQQLNIMQSKPLQFAFKIIQHTSAAVNFVQILDSDVHDLEEHTQNNFIELHSVTQQLLQRHRLH